MSAGGMVIDGVERKATLIAQLCMPLAGRLHQKTISLSKRVLQNGAGVSLKDAPVACPSSPHRDEEAEPVLESGIEVTSRYSSPWLGARDTLNIRASAPPAANATGATEARGHPFKPHLPHCRGPGAAATRHTPPRGVPRGLRGRHAGPT